MDPWSWFNKRLYIQSTVCVAYLQSFPTIYNRIKLFFFLFSSCLIHVFKKKKVLDGIWKRLDRKSLNVRLGVQSTWKFVCPWKRTRWNNHFLFFFFFLCFLPAVFPSQEPSNFFFFVIHLFLYCYITIMLFQHVFFFSFQKDNREEEIRKKLRKSGGGGGLFCMGFFSLSLSFLLLLLLFKKRKKKRKRCEHQISGPKLLLRESIKFRDAGRLLYSSIK